MSLSPLRRHLLIVGLVGLLGLLAERTCAATSCDGRSISERNIQVAVAADEEFLQRRVGELQRAMASACGQAFGGGEGDFVLTRVTSDPGGAIHIFVAQMVDDKITGWREVDQDPNEYHSDELRQCLDRTPMAAEILADINTVEAELVELGEVEAWAQQLPCEYYVSEVWGAPGSMWHFFLRSTRAGEGFGLFSTDASTRERALAEATAADEHWDALLADQARAAREEEELLRQLRSRMSMSQQVVALRPSWTAEYVHEHSTSGEREVPSAVLGAPETRKLSDGSTVLVLDSDADGQPDHEVHLDRSGSIVAYRPVDATHGGPGADLAWEGVPSTGDQLRSLGSNVLDLVGAGGVSGGDNPGSVQQKPAGGGSASDYYDGVNELLYVVDRAEAVLLTTMSGAREGPGPLGRVPELLHSVSAAGALVALASRIGDGFESAMQLFSEATSVAQRAGAVGVPSGFANGYLEMSRELPTAVFARVNALVTGDPDPGEASIWAPVVNFLGSVIPGGVGLRTASPTGGASSTTNRALEYLLEDVRSAQSR